ncbi:alpha/beta hydrolase [Microbacterium sp. KR10-403]|uniref:alpha/beta fold hydrolase n=1 Tax=Microbacterium sp. KR10-403 TaxID=3158581 RepID=UPI0032E42220
MAAVRIGDRQVYAEVAGAGEPVLLLHGGFGSIEAVRTLFEALAQTHRVHAYERPGHGRTPDVPGEYDYRRDVDDARAFLDEQEVDAAHLVGYSDGGVIALLLALAHPDRVLSVTAIGANLDATAFADTVPDGIPILPPPEPRADDPDRERQWYARLSPDGPAHADIVLAKLQRLWAKGPEIAPADLEAITAPTLVVSADRDTIRVDHSLLIAASIPRAQLCIVPGATHDLLAERPALIATVVTDFLAEARSRA